MRIHTYTRAFCSRHWCRLYIAPLSEDVDNKLASPSIAFFVQRTASFSLYRAELASSRFRDVSPSSITPHIGLYHDPLVVETPATSCTDVTRIHTHTHTHDTHYFIGRNERLVLSFVLCTASRLVRVSCNVTRGRGDRREKNRRRKGGKEDGPSIIIHVYTRIFTYINTRTREFFLPFDSSIFVYIRVSLKRALGAGKRFSPFDEVRACFPFVVDRLLYYISLSCTITQYCFQIK